MTRLFAILLLISAPLHAQEEPDYAQCQQLFEGALRPLEVMRGLAEKHPASPWAHHFLALALAETGQLEAARAEMGQAIKIDPGQAWHRKALSGLLQQLACREEAIQALDDAIKLEMRPEVKASLESEKAGLESIQTQTSEGGCGTGESASLEFEPGVVIVVLGVLGLLFLLYLRLRV